MNTPKNPLSDLTLSTIMLFLRRRTYLTVAIVSWTVMLMLLLTVLIPQVNLIISHNQDLGTAQAKLDDLKTRTSFLASLDTDTITKNESLMQQVLPSQKPVIPLISSIEKMAQDSSVSLQSYELSPGAVATDASSLAPSTIVVKNIVPGIGSLPLKLDVQGSFAQMNVFFKALDQLVPLVNVKTVAFTVLSISKNVAPQDAVYKASVELDSLYALPKAVRQADSATLVAINPKQQSLINTLSAIVANQPQTAENQFVPTASAGATLRQSIFTY